MTTDSGQMMVILTQGGFIKRIPAAVFRSQHRRGKGVKGMGIREADAVKLLVIADLQDNLVFFTSKGSVFHLKCHEIPVDAARAAKGLSIVDLIPILAGERVAAVLSVPYYQPDLFLLTATGKGKIKKSPIELFNSDLCSGIIATDIEEGDELVAASIAGDEDDVVLVTEQGQSIRFTVKSLLIQGLKRSIHLEEDDKLVSLDVVVRGAYLLIVTANCYGKLTPITEYKKQSAGGMGIKTLTVTEKTGKVAAAKMVKQTQQLMLISKNGLVISTPVKDEDGGVIRIDGNNNQGLLLVHMDEGDRVAAIAAWE